MIGVTNKLAIRDYNFICTDIQGESTNKKNGFNVVVNNNTKTFEHLSIK